MDERVFDYLERKMRWSEDERDHRRGREDERDYRRGVRGTGRGRRGRGGRRDYDMDERDYRRDNRDRDYDYDYDNDYDYDGHDEPLHLTKSDMHKWKKMMKNHDGTKGEHYDAEQISQVAQKLGIKFDEFSEKEFCLAVNMMYSDYGPIVKKYIPPERELQACAELAKAFLDDPDGPEPSEKLALYFHCVVCNADV